MLLGIYVHTVITLTENHAVLSSLDCHVSSDSRENVGKVYAYNPPSAHSWFAVTGDGVGRMFPSESRELKNYVKHSDIP